MASLCCRVRDGELGPTANTTGLGLPLSRALARAGGGWLCLDEVQEARDLPDCRASAPSTAGNTANTEPVDLTTHYW